MARRIDQRALTARSVILSVLLGTEPPRLPVSLLVRTTGLFGIAEGTTRTALSRMSSAGEVRASGASYELSDPGLLRRRDRQQVSRRGDTADWNGRWTQAVVVADGPRPAPARARLRAELERARLAELRDGVWCRPDNLGTTPDADGVMWFSVAPREPEPDLAARLWDLGAWADRAAELIPRLDELTVRLEASDRTPLAEGFVLSADVLRHFQADPLLPAELLPAAWPGPALRAVYDRFDTAYRSVLADWFRAQRTPGDSHPRE